MTGAKFMSKLDLRSGYNQLEIDPSSRHITTFCTHLGLFQYKRLNLGINTASDLFQRAIERVISGIEGTINMSDDIVVSGATREQHDKRLHEVLSRLERAGLTLSVKKCQFARRELDFFGLHFSGDGISVQAEKMESLRNAQAPKSPTELRSLLGLANYCAAYVKDLATIVHPLRHLTKARAEWSWTSEHDELGLRKCSKMI